MGKLTSARKAAHKAGKTQKTACAKRGMKIEESIQEKFLGLCVTCAYADGCAFRRDVAQAVLECDEYEILGSGAERPNAARAARARAPETQLPRFKGLCVDCQIRHRCGLPKPEEGVWHCEEYA